MFDGRGPLGFDLLPAKEDPSLGRLELHLLFFASWISPPCADTVLRETAEICQGFIQGPVRKNTRCWGWRACARLFGRRPAPRPAARLWRIQDKNAEPMIRDSKGKLVPFTKERFEEYTSARPSFFIEDESIVERGGTFVTPAPSDYARCTHALLEAVEEQDTLRLVVADFFNWFAESITTDAIFESLKRKFDKLFPGERRRSDAFLALTVF